jgi:WD40 repeat protein
VLSQDGRTAVIGTRQGLIEIYDAGSGELKATLNAGAPLKILALDHHAKHLAAITQDEQTKTMNSLVQFWDLETLSKSFEFQESGPIKAFAFAPSGDVALSSVFGGRDMRLWKRTETRWTSTNFVTDTPTMNIDFEPGMQTFLVSGNPDGIELWDMAPTPARRSILLGSAGYSDAIFTKDGRRILAKDTRRRHLGAWQTDKASGMMPLYSFSKTAGAVAVSYGPQALVSDGGDVQLLDSDQGTLIRRLIPSVVNPRIFSISADAERVLVADDRSRVLILDLGAPARLRDNPADTAAIARIR